VWKAQKVEIRGDTMGIDVLRLFDEREFGRWRLGEAKQLFV